MVGQYNPHTLIHGILIYLNNYVIIHPLTMIDTGNTAIVQSVYITDLKQSYKITVSLNIHILHLQGSDPA
jgi:hypothetical protein